MVSLVTISNVGTVLGEQGKQMVKRNDEDKEIYSCPNVLNDGVIRIMKLLRDFASWSAHYNGDSVFTSFTLASRFYSDVTLLLWRHAATLTSRCYSGGTLLL